jgi:hypothetical protein
MIHPIVNLLALIYTLACILGWISALMAIAMHIGDNGSPGWLFIIVYFGLLIFSVVGNLYMWAYLHNGKKKKALFSAILPIVLAALFYCFANSSLFQS